MRHLIDPSDLSREETDRLVTLAGDIKANPEKYRDSLRYRKMATLFYEPSTRTRLSFTSAMMELGGEVIGFSDPNSSSVSKGETVRDTVRVVENFADIIAMRHYVEGAQLAASQVSHIPVINAGDGSHNHPTQTLTDLMTITAEIGHVDGITIGLCGDLKYGRTVHSLIKALTLYRDITIWLIAPDELKLPSYVKSELGKSCSIVFKEASTIEQAMPELDILYMTRVQKERFADLDEYERVKDSFVLDEDKMKLAKKKMAVLHPLPRVGEITVGVDDDPRAAYFRQVGYGKFVRMALILTLFGWKDEKNGHRKGEAAPEGCRCHNSRCITNVEPVALRSYVDEEGRTRCLYCDNELR